MALSLDQQNRMDELSAKVGHYLQRKGESLVTAESCTGGWIAQVVTAVPGSSAWFEGGLVTYSNEMKHSVLGVPESELELYGAVSQQVVESMVQGAVRIGNANVSVAVSGVAGPGGGSKEKPVGCVWIGWGINGQVYSERHVYSGNREEVRYQTVMDALEGIISR